MRKNTTIVMMLAGAAFLSAGCSNGEPEWLKLSSLTGDPQWREKALAIWRNSCQLISDGTLEINGRIRPRGSQNEAYFESSWGFSENPDRINNWLVAWPGAFRLETLRSAPEGSIR